MIGWILLALVAIVILRILIWPRSNPFAWPEWVKDARAWLGGAWTWLTTPGWGTTPKGAYPYAKVRWPSQ